MLDIGCGDASLLATLLAACRASPRRASISGARLGLCAIGLRGAAARRDLPPDGRGRARFPRCELRLRHLGDVLPRSRRAADRAVSEALRVLRPGGRFVLVDRFRDTADYGDPSRSTRSSRRPSVCAASNWSHARHAMAAQQQALARPGRYPDGRKPASDLLHPAPRQHRGAEAEIVIERLGLFLRHRAEEDAGRTLPRATPRSKCAIIVEAIRAAAPMAA